MIAEAGRVQSLPGSAQSPFAELAGSGRKVGQEGDDGVGEGEAGPGATGGISGLRPPRMPGPGLHGEGRRTGENDGKRSMDKDKERSGNGNENGQGATGPGETQEEALDSPVSGLVETPGVAALHVASTPSGILKEEGSTRDGMRRAVSWADFSHEDPARLTQVVEFERDGPSSPTSVDSWDGQENAQCHCCWIQ